MKQVQPDSAQAHIDAIHRLIDYLIEHCADRFTAEMSQGVFALLDTFSACQSGQPQPGARQAMREYALGRNYVTAQCAVLLSFAHEIMVLAAGSSGPLADSVAGLRERMSGLHERFFNQELF